MTNPKPPLIIPILTIMKGMPMPERRPEEGLGEKAKKMDVGDCIDVPYARRPFASNMERACRKAGLDCVFSQRRVRDKENGTDVIRIWRIK